MKTVTFSIQIPDWAKWKATDYYGNVWVFENEPVIPDSCWQWVAFGKKMIVFQIQIRVENYSKTKAKIA